MITKKQYYFDYAASTPLDEAVLEEMSPYFSEQFFNPSATYAPAKEVRQSLHDARARVARVLGAKPEEIIFTAGGTEANNLAIQGILGQFPAGTCLIGALEHDSVRMPAHESARMRELPVDEVGHVLLDKIEQLVADDTVLVSVMYANNEIGTIEHLHKITTVLDTIKKRRQSDGNELPLYFHTDACQAANYLNLQVHRLGVDLMTLNGGKIYGPKQSGCLFIKRGTHLSPQIVGGGQEYGYRSGTENVPAIIGFAAALEQAQDMRKAESARLQKLQRHVLKTVSSLSGTVIITGPKKNRLPNNIHLMIPGFKNETLLLQLEQHGILAAAGSACSAQNDEAYSHVLEAIGVDELCARSSIRLTMGRGTDDAAVDALLSALRDLISGKQ